MDSGKYYGAIACIFLVATSSYGTPTPYTSSQSLKFLTSVSSLSQLYTSQPKILDVTTSSFNMMSQNNAASVNNKKKRLGTTIFTSQESTSDAETRRQDGIMLSERNQNHVFGLGISASTWTAIIAPIAFAVGLLVAVLFVIARRWQKKSAHAVADRRIHNNDIRCLGHLETCDTVRLPAKHTNNPPLSNIIPDEAYQDIMEVNKNMFLTKSNKSQITLPQVNSTYGGDDELFINQFSGDVTSEGGTITDPESDVMVLIPKGAIPPGMIQRIYVNVALRSNAFDLNLSCDDFQLTPTVECLAPGLNTFLKPVTIKLPHRAQLEGSDWSFNVKYSQSQVGSIMSWQDAPQTDQLNNQSVFSRSVSFQYNRDFVFVETTHFTTFACSGCGKDKKLKLSAVIYGNYKILDGRQQVNFRAYISDACLDAQKVIGNMERPLNGSRRSVLKPLVIYNGKPWEVDLVSLSDDQWPWKLHCLDKRTKEICLDKCFQCSAAPPSVDFVCVAKNDAVALEGIEAKFTVAQIRRKRADMKHVELLTDNFLFTANVPTPITAGVVCPNPISEPMTSYQKQYVEDNLRLSEVKVLARHLGLKDSQIDAIKHDYQNDMKEQIHQVIVHWERQNGDIATLGKFCRALEKAKKKKVPTATLR